MKRRREVQVRWVDVKSYVGLDRRQRKLLRFFDRRSARADAAPPSLATALRQLRLHQLHGDNEEGLDLFCARARGTAELAEAYGETGVSKLLLQLIEQLKALPPGATQAMADTIEHTMPEIEVAARGVGR